VIKPHVRTTTSARVSVTVEVQVGSWGPDCDLAQVYRQGSDGAIGKLRRLFERESGVRVVSVDAVQALTTDIEVRK
jgi:hypothetical protein